MAGLTDRAIGEALYIGAGTVESHVASILRKLGVRSRATAAAKIAEGIVEPPHPPADSTMDS